jgi:thioredoxin reductase (NADPH)
MPGVFASGDVRSGATMQIASAVGEGATAALSIREYLDKQKQQQTALASLSSV